MDSSWTLRADPDGSASLDECHTRDGECGEWVQRMMLRLWAGCELKGLNKE